ncbi:putative thioesterase [Chroococcidiopsis sp. CCALA 051]|uniref:thioesterase II family protein n=1 Tax=Chroococcidiopsis sp. CCALA 051 TaxID=869949 RepID=UPI000D0D7529|nr:thioesterase II family protein [Chroococcidiopsis sp. CCALA 051]MBE9016055.1 thioesterase [Chroococcidiopsidales cyanobacterium LEGE 13417]PSM47787.1 putative thioesterase [Chroococcidiopsis sp. CCALA 051]
MTTTSNFNTWIARSQPNSQAKMRLFCLPYAGGGAMTYRRWADSLSPSVEVCAVELPGRGMRLREKPFTRLDALVEAIAIAIRPDLDKPLALFGHSMGAIVSFELARLLRRQYGIDPVYLFVSGRRAPQIPHPKPPTYNLPEPAFLAELRRLNGTPAAVLENTELLQLVLPTVRSDFEALETYRYQPEPPLDCAIAAFGGLSDAETNIQELEAWTEQTTAAFSLYMLPGDHFFLDSAQAQIVQCLTQHLQLV